MTTQFYDVGFETIERFEVAKRVSLDATWELKGIHKKQCLNGKTKQKT